MKVRMELEHDPFLIAFASIVVLGHGLIVAVLEWMTSSGKDVLLVHLDVMQVPRSHPKQLARVLEQQLQMDELLM